MWQARRVRKRLGIPPDETLQAWAMADYRGIQVPAPRMEPTKYWPPVVALTPGALWLSCTGATRRFPLEDIVLVSTADDPEGALRVDFMSGKPLVILVTDGGTFLGRLAGPGPEPSTRGSRWTHLMHAGVPELPPGMVAAAEQAERRAARLLAGHAGDPGFRMAADRHMAEAHELRHQARVEALRHRRSEHLAHAAAPSSRGVPEPPIRSGSRDGSAGSTEVTRAVSVRHAARLGGRVEAGRRLRASPTLGSARPRRLH